MKILLRLVGVIYDKNKNCLGKFLVDDAGLDEFNIAKYLFICNDEDGINRCWETSDNFKNCIPKLGCCEILPKDIYLCAILYGSEYADPDPIGNMCFHYSKIYDGIYEIDKMDIVNYE